MVTRRMRLFECVVVVMSSGNTNVRKGEMNIDREMEMSVRMHRQAAVDDLGAEINEYEHIYEIVQYDSGNMEAFRVLLLGEPRLSDFQSYVDSESKALLFVEVNDMQAVQEALRDLSLHRWHVVCPRSVLYILCEVLDTISHSKRPQSRADKRATLRCVKKN